MINNINDTNKTTSVLSYVWRYPGTHRKEVANILGIRLNTVTNIVKNLLNEDWLEERKLEPQSVGRAPISLCVNKKNKLVAAFTYDNQELYGTLLNSTGELIVEDRERLKLKEPSDLYKALEKVYNRLSLKTNSEIVAVGIADNGMIDFCKGTIIRSELFPNLRNIPLKEEVASRLGLPVFVEDYTRACAFSEYMSKPEWRQNNSSMMYMEYGERVGFAFVSPNGVWSGKGLAGELGHVIIMPDGPLCRCGAKGCLESLINFDAVKRKTIEISEHTTNSLLNRHESFKVKNVFEAYMRGDRAAKTVLDSFFPYIGMSLSILVSTMHPDFMVIGSHVSSASACIAEGVKKEMDIRTLPEIASSIKVISATINKTTALKGISLMAFDKMIMSKSQMLISS